MTWAFLLTTFVIVAAPGTGAIYTIATALAGGTRASVIAALGCAIGIVPHLLAAISGVAALFHTSDVAFEALRIAGVAYLLFMALSMLRAGGGITADAEQETRTARQIIVKAVLLNLLNPKLAIFFLAYLPQFVGVDDPSPLSRMLLLSLVFIVMTFVVFAIYSVFAAALQRRVLASRRVQGWLQKGFAAAFGLLALQLALASR